MGSLEVVVVGYHGAELVDIACVTGALDLANRLGATPAYHLTLASLDGGDIACNTGLILRAQARLASIRTLDTLVVSGGLGHRAAADDRLLIQQVARLAHLARRVTSVCTGATVLAEAGLLDGRRATTHWYYADELAARYPAVRVDAAPIFIRDGNVATSGGVTASLDLTLSLIAEDHDAEIARRVAMGMVTYLQRPGNQAQMSIFNTSPPSDDATVRSVINHVIAHPGDDLSLAALADRAGVSTRQLTRVFRDRTGDPPAAAIRRIRLEIAGRLIATTDLPLSQVARRCGFGSAETLRQAFTARFGSSPQTLRRSMAATGTMAS